MKKYISIVIAILSVVLSSCSNEDISIQKECTIRVNPNTVISDFEEYNAGELTVIPNRYQLRIHLFVYDLSGNLVYSGIEYSPDYSHYVTFTNVNLQYGEFILLTTTDIVRTDDFEYWTFSDEQTLTQLTIVSNNYVSEQRGILGYACKRVNINRNNDALFEIDAKPAGSLIFANVQKMKSIADVESYELCTNRDCERVQFNSNGELKPSIKSSNTFDWRTVILDVDDLSGSYTGLYTYYFSVEINNAKFEWHGITKDNKFRVLGDSYTCSMNMGDQFKFVLDANTRKATWEQVKTGLFSTRSFEDALSSCGDNIVIR